ncbi:Disease resistance protein RPM1 [Sesamum alatum]|uniref:Disease resistance protein RPM1 n=1 Tax=Sesamum alatum TaxID=300844 RepID=A0AAE1YRM5_9LAMI|nr:Disease resistance protein RPM1 [Sesamum alatum]
MAESAICFLFQQLSIWLQEEQKLIGRLRHEAEFIRGEMGQMRAFLRVADDKEESDLQLKEWVRQVREIAYDTEDILEKYIFQFAHQHARGFRGSLEKMYTTIKNLKARDEIASEIQAIRYRVQNASQSQQRYRDMYATMLPGSSLTLATANTWYDGRGDALLLEETEVVGIEKPKKQLLDWLSSTNCGLKVISVVGMAGLGKTTLVKKVYDDPSVKVNFDHHVWVTVSESFRIAQLLQDIIKRLVEEVKQAPPQGLEAMNDVGMREFIYNFLQNNNYIIVLDDVWTTNAWEAVRYAFPRSSTCGRGCVIITTRLSNVASAACSESNCHIYRLPPLPAQESKELFNRKAFPGSSCPLYLEEISESILKRCKGLPLAIVLIGGLLATKNNRIEEWQTFNQSLGSELEEDNLKRMWRLLWLSYYDLPYYLKSCFLYLSIFQEDQLIEKATIIRLWIAEGFVEAKQGKTLEQIAEGYLNELSNRSLIQVAETSRDGRPRNFHIHDLLRECIISKSREQNMVFVNSRGDSRWPDKIRRLALDSSINCAHQTCCFKNLRSLLLLRTVDSECASVCIRVLRGGSRLLKVLDLRKAPLDTIPDEVFTLYHLRYLSLRETRVEVIPKIIGNLKKLETLDLKGCWVTELPAEILKLERLRILLVYRYYGGFNAYLQAEDVQSFKAPYKIGCLLSLQKLCFIDTNETVVIREIGKLTQLQRLGITKLRREHGKELCSSLANLTNLRSLNIHADVGEALDLQYALSSSSSASIFPFLRCLVLNGSLDTLPEWIPSLNALTMLRLSWSGLREDPLELLQDLPNLLILGLDCAYEGEGLSIKAGGFQRLKRLNLMGLRRLGWVTVEEGSMPRLEELMVRDCKSMAELPADFRHMTNLRRVWFTDMGKEFVERVSEERRRQGDQWKLAHVATVRFLNTATGVIKTRAVDENVDSRFSTSDADYPDFIGR